MACRNVLVGLLGHPCGGVGAGLDRAERVRDRSAAIGGPSMGTSLMVPELDIADQSILPNWVRGRALAVYWLVLQGSIAGGAFVWGAVAGASSVHLALLAAAAATLIIGLAAVPLRLAGRADVDIQIVNSWLPHVPMTTLDREAGPLLVTVEWRVRPEDVPRLATRMRAMEQQRRRTGAIGWRLFQDLGQPGRVLETYTFATFAEHQHQHQRITAQDRLEQQAAGELLIEQPPAITHLIAVRPRS
jgi:hypothetical protein